MACLRFPPDRPIDHSLKSRIENECASQLPEAQSGKSKDCARRKGESMSTHTSPGSKAAKATNPDGFAPEKVKDLSNVLNALLADVYALYLKTKNFHWHMSGPHFRDYHLLLDEQGDQIFAIADPIAERVRKIGGLTIRSIGHIARLQRIADNDQEFVSAHDMLIELHGDNKAFVESLRAAHEVASRCNDYATTSLIEVWIDEAERRAWFLFEATR
jgi:starvation-inducible DNA-binding protein